MSVEEQEMPTENIVCDLRKKQGLKGGQERKELLRNRMERRAPLPPHQEAEGV